MPQFPLCSEFIPLLDTVKNQLAELKNLSQEFLSSGNEETKREAFLKAEELEKTKRQMVELKEQPTYFEGHQIARIEKELLVFFRDKVGYDFTYEFSRHEIRAVTEIRAVSSRKSDGTLESVLKFVRLFSKLLNFTCYDTGITVLPELPQSTEEIECYNAQITILPELPRSLQKLDCSHNQIGILPKLPRGLQKLYCHDTQITALPELPRDLQYLMCYNTQITSLPELPQSLQRLDCNNTKIAILPELPRSLRFLNCLNTPASKNSETKKQLEEFKKNHPQFYYLI